MGGNDKERDDLNFRETLKSIKKSIILWKWRGLSLLRRIQIIKTFAIPKLMFRASVIPISKELIKKTRIQFFTVSFGMAKTKFKEMFFLNASIENGGLDMRDIDSMIRTKRVKITEVSGHFFLKSDSRLLVEVLHFIAISIPPSY